MGMIHHGAQKIIEKCGEEDIEANIDEIMAKAKEKTKELEK